LGYAECKGNVGKKKNIQCVDLARIHVRKERTMHEYIESKPHGETAIGNCLN